MELDFDKEINALLRQAAKDSNQWSVVDGQNSVNPQSAIGNPQSHLDADGISAFAENALPEKARNVYIKHFADCNRCRTILSNTILLNSEAEIATASNFVKNAEPEIVETKIPWYRKMFLMPNLAYTMGALVLVFGGMFGFLVLQNVNKGTSSEVSQINTDKAETRGPNATDEGVFYNSNAAATTSNAMANTANTSANVSSTNTSATVSNSSVSANPSESKDNPTVPLNSPAKEPFSLDSTDTATSNEVQLSDREKNNKQDSELPLSERSLSESKSKPADDEKEKEEAVLKSVPAPKAVPPPPAAGATLQSEAKKDDRALAKKSARRDASSDENRRQIAGRTFNRVGGVWIDSAYNNDSSSNMMLPPTRTIRRGSDEYKKLDKQVRIIAESLSGPVIIVWKVGAYRIQ